MSSYGPSTSTRNTVRNGSCRATTSSTARRSASTSSGPVNRTRKGMLYEPSVGSPCASSQMRCCTGDNGIRSGRVPATGPSGLPSSRQVSIPRDRSARASRRGVGSSNRSRIPTGWSRTADSRLARRVAVSELPPASKNDVVAPTAGTPSTSAKVVAMPRSRSSAGATWSPGVVAVRSGAGSARRSSLPFAVVGNRSRTITAPGTMNGGRSRATAVRTVAGSGRRPAVPVT